MDETTSDAFPSYDFGGAKFNLRDPGDREIVRFVLSQALFGEATGVYCGKSLYSAGSLEAARFYLRQARQELGHLNLFADIFRLLDMEPAPGHWVLRLLSSHNNYYPLKVLMEHAVGEGLVLDVFKDILLQTLPDDTDELKQIHRKLQVICREEAEHVAWGERETARILREKPWLRLPFYGLVELQLNALPLLIRQFRSGYADHPVVGQLEPFLDHVKRRVMAQGRELGFIPPGEPSLAYRMAAGTLGVALYARSQFARSRSTLDKTYLDELGFTASSS